MSANLRGITFMISAMAMFTLSDLFLKLAARSYSAPEIMLVMGLIGGALFGTLARINALPLFGAAFFAPTVMLRNGSELIGTFCIISALTLAPLSLVTSITQATPLVVTAGAALILRERVGLRRWLAVLAGFGGVLLILRPGVIEISWGMLAALGAVMFLGLRDVITRAVPANIHTLQLASYSFLFLIPAGILLIWLSPSDLTKSLRDVPWLILSILFAAAAIFAITSAMRAGEVSAIIPFRYSRMIFALIAAMLFLGERPDALTLIGVAIIIGSGLFVMRRQRQLATQKAD